MATTTAQTEIKNFINGEEKARVVGARGKDAILREIEPQIAA